MAPQVKRERTTLYIPMKSKYIKSHTVFTKYIFME
jgi:hypothetical protein